MGDDEATKNLVDKLATAGVTVDNAYRAMQTSLLEACRLLLDGATYDFEDVNKIADGLSQIVAGCKAIDQAACSLRAEWTLNH